MKKLKEEPSSPQAKPKEERGFVGECLVKVECEDGASVERLQVRVCVCEATGEGRGEASGEGVYRYVYRDEGACEWLYPFGKDLLGIKFATYIGPEMGSVDL